MNHADVGAVLPIEQTPTPDDVLQARSEGRLALAFLDQLRSPAGVPIPTSPKPILHLLGGFRRNIHGIGKKFDPTAVIRPSQAQPGLQLFESPEHESLASSIKLYYTPTQYWDSSSESISLAGGASVTYAETVALAGDFFGVPSQPISDGADATQQQQRFMNAFATLDNASPDYVQGILDLINQQSAQVTAALSNYTGDADAYSQAYTQVNSGYAYDCAYNGATGGMNPYDPNNHNTTVLGQYTKLAGTNWDHFGEHAVLAYQAGHAVALQAALQARQTGSQFYLMRAYIMDAFACHFLSDLFAAGHLRTPRKALWGSLDPTPSLCAQIMHDEDNYNGLYVTNLASGNSWTAWGDKRLLDSVNFLNLSTTQMALQASADEIFQAFFNGMVPTSYSALQLIPILSQVINPANPKNWDPLFTVPTVSDEMNGNNDSVEIRISPYQLRANYYVNIAAASLLSPVPDYLLVWLYLPTGGVHSVDGAPPGQINQWAHKFTWQTPPTRLDKGLSAPINNVAALAAAVMVPKPAILDSHPTISNPPPLGPGGLPEAGSKDLLHVFYRLSNSNQIQHLTTTMVNLPDLSSPCTVWAVPQAWQTNGGIAAVDFEGVVVLLFPLASGQIVMYEQTATGWSVQKQLIGTGASGGGFVMPATGTPALAVSGGCMYLAYRNSNQVIQYGVFVNGGWQGPYTLTVGGNSITAGSNPSLVVDGKYLYMIVGGASSSSGNDVRTYRIAISQSGTSGNWSLYLPNLPASTNGSNSTWKVRSFAQGFAYADTYLVLATNTNNTIITIAPAVNSKPTGSWGAVRVPTTNSGNGAPFAQTGIRMTAFIYQGRPFLIYADLDASNAPMIIGGMAPLGNSNPPT